jgi:dihydrofolate reductase
MRKIFLFMMTSVEGYFEGPNHDLSWHNVDAEFNAFAHEQNIGPVDTLLFGRTTYELMAGYWPTPAGVADDPETARFMNETPKVVASFQPFAPAWEKTTVIFKDVEEEIKRLKAGPGKAIAIFGSNQLCVSLMEKGLVDEFRIMVNPIVLGAGHSLFAGLSKRVKLKLVNTRAFRSGNILLTYMPV